MAALQPLSSKIKQVRLREPLPFGICDAEGRLLLARGQVIHSEGQLEGLLDRGAFVHRDLGAEAVERIRDAKPHQLPGLWNESDAQMGRVLRANVDTNFEKSLDAAAQPVLALIRRDPDLAILQVVRSDDDSVTNYANRHSLHAGIAGHLAAQRLGWGADAGHSFFRAALTMNLAMSELQNRLAAQVTPLTPLQRQMIHDHPRRGADLLRTAGVTDPLWIEAVERHHELPDGKGYPLGRTDVHEVAFLLNRTDAFTARFSARVSRSAQPPDLAVRQFFAANAKDSITAAIVKEFGLYPPGTAVRLKSGELGIVMRRGETAATPVVAVVCSRSGDQLMEPVRRDTAQPAHAVAAVVPSALLKVRVSTERLMQACSN